MPVKHIPNFLQNINIPVGIRQEQLFDNSCIQIRGASSISARKTMPLFEFVCTDCEQSFEELLRSADTVSEVSCPRCGGGQVKKKLSTFTSKTTSVSAFSLGSSASSCSTGGT